MAGVVEAVLVEDEGVGQSADFQQTVPVRGAAGQPRDLQAQHDPDLAHADGGYQLLEAFAVTRGTGLAEVTVDDDDSLPRPAESYRTFPKAVLALGALRVLEHLAQRALPDVEVRLPLQMARCHLLVSGHISAHHSTPSHRLI